MEKKLYDIINKYINYNISIKKIQKYLINNNKKYELLDYKEINKIINNNYDEKIVNELKDENLLDIYIKTKSVKNKKENLENILIKNNISKDKIDNIIKDYIKELIPPGTKGVIRGNKFNEIIKEYLLNLDISKNKDYELCFEKKCILLETNEKPDWYILHKKTKRLIIGMNQLDLWNGGQQLNRGYKYIEFNKKNTKLLCVICNKVILQNNKNKIYKLFQKGIKYKNICYINQLENIINEYFNYHS